MGIRILGWVIAVSAFLTPVAAGAGGEVDAQRLKKVLRFPTLQLRVSFGVSSAGPFDGDAPLTEYDPDAEIARAMGELKGDAGDASRYAFLASLHRYAGDEAKAAECRKKSLDLYRKRVDSSPEDAALLAEMAPVLRDAGLDAEAEKALRRAVSIAPGHWEFWSDLSAHLAMGALGTLSGRRFTEIQALFNLLLQPGQGPPPSLTEPVASAARACLAEARSCADRAVSIAPGNSGPLLARSFLRMGELSWGVRTGALGFEDFVSACDEFVSAFSAAAAENAKDAGLQSAASLSSLAFVLMRSAAEQADAADARDRAKLFRGKSEELARVTAKRYETLGEGKDPRASAAALATAAMIRMFVEERKEAEADARRAVSLDPAMEKSWRILIGLLVEKQRFEEMAAVCRTSIAAQDTSFKRLILAKSLFLTGDAAKAEEEVRVALKLDARRLEANLALAALLLRRAKDPRDIEEAGRLIAKAEETLAVRTRVGTATDLTRAECATVKAVHRGLTGDMTGAADCVRRLRELDPQNRDAREILEALGL